jgi:hypothetical protein
MKIVSLGTNCEASFRIEDYTGKPIDAYIFSWTETHDPLKQLDAIKDLESLKDSEWYVNEHKLAVNKRYEIGFHFKDLPSDLFDKNGNLIQDVYESGLKELKSRMSHLIEKTERLFENQSGDDILFVYKVEINDPSNRTPKYVRNLVKNLFKILKHKVKNGHFMLMVLVDDKKIFEFLTKHIKRQNLSFHLLSFFPPHDQRNLESDKKSWNFSFHDAVLKFEQYKFIKVRGLLRYLYNKYRYHEDRFKNLILGLNNERWRPTKSGDAIGSYDCETGIIKCKSSSICYFGMIYDINPEHIIGENLKLALEVSNVCSDRSDVGYLQIWENYKDNPEVTVPKYLLNIRQHGGFYEIIYKVPENLKKLRIVVQTKNGSFKIDNISLKKTFIN